MNYKETDLNTKLRIAPQNLKLYFWKYPYNLPRFKNLFQTLVG